jgi:hypothetical protein
VISDFRVMDDQRELFGPPRMASRSDLEGPPERRVTVRRMQRPTCEILNCMDLGTMVSEDPCSEGGRSSGRLSEAS